MSTIEQEKRLPVFTREEMEKLIASINRFEHLTLLVEAIGEGEVMASSIHSMLKPLDFELGNFASLIEDRLREGGGQ